MEKDFDFKVPLRHVDGSYHFNGDEIKTRFELIKVERYMSYRRSIAYELTFVRNLIIGDSSITDIEFSIQLNQEEYSRFLELCKDDEFYVDKWLQSENFPLPDDVKWLS